MATRRIRNFSNATPGTHLIILIAVNGAFLVRRSSFLRLPKRKQFQLISDSFIYAGHYLSYYYMIRRKCGWLIYYASEPPRPQNAKDRME